MNRALSMDPGACDTLFAGVVRQHMGIFLKTAYAFGLPADRDDLVQEILLAVWQALPAFEEGRCKLSTFLYRVAHNRASNWRRSRTRYERKLQELAVMPHLTLEGDDGLQQRQREWLYAVIRRLPALDRTLLLLQLDRLSYQEIAEVTGLTESNVGVRLHRIRQALADQKPGEINEL